jgi:segregation and condensation protein B
MKRDLEALLFATDTPLSTTRLKQLLPGASGRDLREAVTALQEEYERGGHAFTIVEFGGGWQVATRPDYAPLVEKLYRGRSFARLSRPALEVLAVVAYRQPVSRLEIEDVRGVQSSGVLATLMERNLVTVVGRAETVGHPLLYGTTREFLNYLGLKGLNQLPQLASLEGVIEDREALQRFARELGREVTDEDLSAWRGPEPEPESGPGAEAGGGPDQEPAGASGVQASADPTAQDAAELQTPNAGAPAKDDAVAPRRSPERAD